MLRAQEAGVRMCLPDVLGCLQASAGVHEPWGGFCDCVAFETWEVACLHCRAVIRVSRVVF